MAWDPNQNQGQGQPGSGGQGQPGSGGPDPYSGYGTPPPQNPYATPPPQQGPYGAPPPQYGTPPYQQGGYGYVPPQQAPRPLGQAIQELPNQYIKVLTKPSAQSFAEEMGKADWGIVWVQLLALAVLGTILGIIRGAINLSATAASNPFATTSGFNPAALLALTVGGSAFSFISVPLFFFILVGIQYLLAKAFQGMGSFLTQSYTTLLFWVPINAASYILGLIPIFGAIAGFALSIYSIILNVYAIMAVHRLSGGRATAVVLIPIAVVILLVILCIVAIVAILVAAGVRNT
jgi:hypothetical protein